MRSPVSSTRRPAAFSVNGKPLRLGSTAEALRHNVMFVSGDRAEEGVFRRLSVLDNLVATRLGAFARLGVLNRAAHEAEGARACASGRGRPAPPARAR